MSKKFRNKYRIPPARKPNWDYAWSANYFITICTKDRQPLFGDILDGEMRLSEIGKIVESEWLKTSEIRSDMNVHLGAFVIMPNHFHAIITIGDNEFNNPHRRDALNASPLNTSPLNASSVEMRPQHGVSTNEMDFKNAFIPQSKNLASIVRGFKSGVTSKALHIHADFGWQTRFHDHIIRNSESHDKIERYILNNPMNWADDKLHPKSP